MSSSTEFAMPNTERAGQTTTQLIGLSGTNGSLNNMTTNFWFWVIVVIGIILLIVALIVVIMLARRCPRPTTSEIVYSVIPQEHLVVGQPTQAQVSSTPKVRVGPSRW